MTRRHGMAFVRLGALVAALALLGGCAAAGNHGGTGRAVSGLASALGELPQRSVAPLPTTRLAPDLVPPTNRWFSGLVFGATPQPVFPLPLSFTLTATGFAFGVPRVTSGADTITGELNPAISVDAGAASSEIIRYDTASVTIAQKDATGAAIGSEVIAEGSPLVSFTAKRAVSLRVGVPFTAVGGGVFAASVGESGYGLKTQGRVASGGVRLSAGQTAVWFAVPASGSAARLAKHVSPVTATALSYSVAGGKVTTAIRYRSAGANVVAALPHQLAGLRSPASCNLGRYPSVYGTMSLCAGPTLAWTAPRVAVSDTLDVAGLSSAQKSVLRHQLGRDLAASPQPPADSYFGGKALYRLANLASLAHSLGDTSAETAAERRLDAGLARWTDPHGCAERSTQCFVYDPKARGIVGLTASFGSDQFNDHDFHYGYFLYAASVEARLQPSKLAALKPVINLLAADLATSGRSTKFPERRTFDAYAGHSWASGYAPFADGNNQESSSEAVNAWNGLSLWASVSGNHALRTEAEWMLSAEAASARAYWTGFDPGDTVYAGYRHGIVGINWGGKRDYATWFSADPNAKLAIQLLPMSPASGYLGGDPKRIASNVAEATPGGFAVPLGDYTLMYSALGGHAAAQSALATARSLPERFIDGADSRSYLLAWIMTR